MGGIWHWFWCLFYFYAFHCYITWSYKNSIELNECVLSILPIKCIFPVNTSLWFRHLNFLERGHGYSLFSSQGYQISVLSFLSEMLNSNLEGYKLSPSCYPLKKTFFAVSEIPYLSFPGVSNKDKQATNFKNMSKFL